MRTEERLDALVAHAKKALAGVQGKRPAENDSVWDAQWTDFEVHGVFYPAQGGMPVETTPSIAPSVLIMPTSGADSQDEEKIKIRMLATVYEPGDRVTAVEARTGALRELSDRGAGWRAVMLVVDKLRDAFRAGWRVQEAALTVREITWSLYTEEGLVPDLRPLYCAWVVLDCCAGPGVDRSDEINELLN